MHADSKRRKRLIVLPGLQRRLILSAAVWPLIMLSAAAGLVAMGCLVVALQAEEAQTVLPGLALLEWAFAGLFLVAASVILGQALVFSHRIAGPIYRFQLSLDRVTAGELGFRIQLRKKDFLQETAEHFNSMLDALEKRTADGTRPAREPLATCRDHQPALAGTTLPVTGSIRDS